jgi:DNA-binding transcriptional ArsR family regulator
MSEDILILEPGDERAQKIAKAISSPTAGDILNQMKEGNYTASQLADNLDLPLTTVQYHLENLVSAAILSITDKKWSKKGREIKVYGLRNQVVIVAPHPGDLRSLLLKYTSLFVIVLLAGVLMFSLMTMFAGSGSEPPPMLQKGASEETVRGDTLSTAVTSEENGYLPLIYFILGGSAAIVALAGYELRKRRSLAAIPVATPSIDQ